MAAKAILAIGMVFLAAAPPGEGPATESRVMQLPSPQTTGGRPLMAVLKDRHSSRAFSSRPLPHQVLSDLLWAACGVNRPDGRRTAPTARNMQQIDVYVALPEGLYLFDPREHALRPVVAEDLRALTGTQAFAATAPLNLIFVADYARMGGGSDESKAFYAATDTGFSSQNVYLYCASEGLATVVRGMVNREALAAAMGLRPQQHIVLAQTVGYPAEPQ
ncbi:MAG: SagB/ThcOx family dehydrogenase [Candidatus Brocadiaceae bacterium]|nr:SagB/ThcOx family dehydrogenase [Candidatus Brocadiaceae bacterium]